MADISKTVEILFSGKSELGATLSQIDADFTKLGKSVDAIATPLAKVAEEALAATTAIVGIAGTAMALAISKAADFSASFGVMSSHINASQADLQALQDGILKYAQGSTRSIADIQAAIDTAIRTGVNYGDSLGVIAQAEKLAVATRSDLTTSTRLLTATMNGFGASAGEASHYADILFEITKKGQVDLPQLSEGLAQLTGMAKAGGIPLEMLGAAIVALTQSGLPAETAISGLKNVLLKLEAPSSTATKLANELNIAYGSAAVKAKGFDVVLQESYKATNGSAEQMKELYGGIRGFNVAAVLGADAAGNFKKEIAAMGQITGQAAAEYDKSSGSFQNTNQNMKNNFDVVFIDIGKRILQFSTDEKSALAEMFKGIKIGVDSGAFDPLFKYLADTWKSINVWLTDVGKAFPEAFKQLDFSKLVEALRGFGNAITELFATDKDKPKELAESMQRVIDTSTSLITLTKGIGEVFVPFMTGAKNATDGFNKLDESTKTMTGNLLGASLAFKMFGPVAGGVLLALSVDADASAVAMKAAFGAIEIAINSIVLAFTVAAYTISKGVQGIMTVAALLPGSGIGEKELETMRQWCAFLEDKMVSGADKVAKSFVNIASGIDGSDVAAAKLKKSLGEIPKDVSVIVAPKLDPLATQETQWNLTQAFFSKDKNKIDLYTTMQMTEVMLAKAALANEIPPKQAVSIVVLADGTSIETTKKEIITKFPDGGGIIQSVKMTIDEWNLAATKARLTTEIPKEKQVEIQAKLDEAKIKASAEVIQKAIEWKAKLDIADVEANAKIIEAAFKSIDNSITSTGTTIASEMSSYATLLGTGKSGSSFIEQQITDENRRRDEALKMQQDLTTAEIDNMKARTESLRAGQAMITINGAGLQPHLEAFMFEILAAIQVKANAEGQKFLVGI